MTKIQQNFRQPPGPSATYDLGINSETLIVLQKLQKKYGDTVCITKPNGKIAYFINDVFDIKRMLTRRHSKYLKGPGFERVKMLLGNGIIVSDGETWQRSRRMIQPAFSRQNIHQLINRMIECSNRRVKHWKTISSNNEVCNITAETSDFALELILISIFSDEYKTRISTEEKRGRACCPMAACGSSCRHTALARTSLRWAMAPSGDGCCTRPATRHPLASFARSTPTAAC